MNFLKDKVFKPIVKPVVNIADKAAPILGLAANAIVPGSGAAVTAGIKGAKAITDVVDSGNLKEIGNAIKSGKIRLK